MRRVISACLAGLAFWASAAGAVPGEEKPVTTVYGQKMVMRDSDDLLPTFALLGRARHVAEQRGGKMEKPVFILIAAADYDTFDKDKDMGPFVQAARRREADEVVFVLAAGGEMKHVVFFKGDMPDFYADAGKRATVASAQDVAQALEAVPPEPKIVTGPDSGNPYKYYVRWRPLTIHADNGTPVSAYQIVYEGKPETPWPFGENKPGDAAMQPKQ